MRATLTALAAAAPPLPRLRALSFITRFYHPDLEGMDPDRMEILSQSSAFLVRASSDLRSAPGAGRPPRLHVVSSQHVSHPWNFPKYYPEDTHAFVHILRDEHVSRAVEVRDGATGGVHAAATLRRRLFTHPSRDVVVGHLATEEEEDALLELVEPLELAPARAGLGTALTFEGHILRPLLDSNGQPLSAATGTTTPAAEDAPLAHLPRSVAGHILLRSDLQVFARTAETLEIGMCGGPVLDESGRCVGLTEGIVPTTTTPSSSAAAGKAANGKAPTSALEVLAGAAVFVECDDLAACLAAVEARWGGGGSSGGDGGGGFPSMD